MLIYFLRLKTEGGWRYLGDRSKYVNLTLHPSCAERLDMNEPLPRRVGDAIDEHGSGEFVIVKDAECLNPGCACTWRDERPILTGAQ